MSRSYKKTPICGNAGGSEKKDKRINNRMFRRRTNQMITVGRYDDIPYDMNEVRNLWDMNKDGKSWVGYLIHKSNFVHYCYRTHELCDDEEYYTDLYKKIMRK